MNDYNLSSTKENITEDHATIQRILDGDKNLFEKLIRKNNQKLFRVIRSYISNDEEVRDVMQEAYINAYLALPKFRMESSFTTWLIRIGINEAYKKLRKDNRISSFETDEVNDRVLESAPSEINYTTPEKQIINEEIHVALTKAIDELPEKYRVVYVMREVEGHDGKETADMLEISESNVKVRLHRAKDMLKDYLMLENIDHNFVYEFGMWNCDLLTEKVMGHIHSSA